MNVSGDNVRFGGRPVAIIGVLAGLAMMLGTTALVLWLGASLHWGVQVTLIVLGGLGGVVVAGISAFFGLVIPTTVESGPDRPKTQPVEPKPDPQSASPAQ